MPTLGSRIFPPTLTEYLNEPETPGLMAPEGTLGPLKRDSVKGEPESNVIRNAIPELIHFIVSPRVDQRSTSMGLQVGLPCASTSIVISFTEGPPPGELIQSYLLKCGRGVGYGRATLWYSTSDARGRNSGSSRTTNAEVPNFLDFSRAAIAAGSWPNCSSTLAASSWISGLSGFSRRARCSKSNAGLFSRSMAW